MRCDERRTCRKRASEVRAQTGCTHNSTSRHAFQRLTSTANVHPDPPPDKIQNAQSNTAYSAYNTHRRLSSIGGDFFAICINKSPSMQKPSAPFPAAVLFLSYNHSPNVDIRSVLTYHYIQNQNVQGGTIHEKTNFPVLLSDADVHVPASALRARRGNRRRL